MHVKRSKQKAGLIPRAHSVFSPPLLEGIVISLTGSCYIMSIVALQVSPSMETKTPGSKHKPLGWHSCDCPLCCLETHW